MAGPWEDYGGQSVAAGPGPWNDFGGVDNPVQPGPRVAQDMAEAVFAGLQSSATGLALRRDLPARVLAEDAPWNQRLAANAAGVVADLPLSILAAFPGGAAGTAVGGPGVGTAVGAGAAAFAAPMALRDALMTAYGQNHARSWSDVWEIAKSAMSGGTKGAVIGAATMGAGKAVAPLVAGAGTAARVGVPLAAELGALTTTAAALEGHLPTAQDFMDNAILLGGMKGAVAVAGKMRAVYTETGKHPAQVAADALKDPALRAELVGEAREIPAAYRDLAIEERVRAAVAEDARPEMIRQRMSEALKEEPPMLGALKETDPVKYEYVVDGPTAQGVLRSVEQLYRSELETQTRGVVSDKATAIEAMRRVTSGIPDHIIGEAESASMLFARAHLLRGATERASQKMKDLALRDPLEITEMEKLAAYAELERVSVLYKELAGAGAEVGRALHILRTIKQDASLLGDAKTIVTLMEKKGKFQDIAALAAALKDPAQMARFAQEMQKATTTEQVVEGWKAAILSGPQTHMANIMGNMMKFGVEVPETVFATSITAVRRAMEGGGMGFAEFKAKALAPLYGLRWGVRDSLVIASEALRGEGTHLEKADVYRHAIPGKAGYWIRTPFRALQAEDVLFRTVAERGKSHEMAVERAVREGFTPETREFNDKVAQYTMQPDFGLSAPEAVKALADVAQAGAEAVFAQRLGPKMEMVQAAMAGSPMQFLVPFVRTPVNLLSWAIQHSPGFMLSARWRNDFAAGGALRDRAAARLVIGTGLAALAFSFAEDGILTGGGTFDPEKRHAADWQPYSIKIGDTYYSYRRLEPVAKVLGFAADYLEMQKMLEDDDRAKGMMALVAMFGNATISTTYLSGLAGTLNALTDPTRYSERWFEQYASSLVPKAIGQVTMMADPHKREINGVVDAIQAQLPFLREKLMPARDVWGEPKKNERLFGVLPVATSEESHNKVKSEALRLELAITDVPKFLLEKGPLKPGERRIDLTPEQRDIARQVAGANAMAILSPIVNSSDWNNIPDFAKAMVYQRVLEATRAQGRQAALPANAPEREAMRKKIVDEINRQARSTPGGKIE